jgi:predicted molibdopterin-dependent oxidoreductase YjgC
MGLLPDLLPGYVPVTAPGAFAEYAGMPATPGKTLPEMVDAAAKGTGRAAGGWRRSGGQAGVRRAKS